MTDKQRENLIDLLQTAYSMELESVENYLAAATNLEGIHALEVKRVLMDEVTDELEHAKLLAERIHTLGGTVQGSMQLRKNQRSLQPSNEGISLEKVIAGVIEAEEGAISHYRLIAEVAGEFDLPTEDIAVQLLADEEKHRRIFAGMLKSVIGSSELEDPDLKKRIQDVETTF